MNCNNTELHRILIDLAEDYQGTPYFLLNYERLQKETRLQSTWSQANEAIVIGCNIGYIFGEVNYSRNISCKGCHSSDIYFIYIHHQYRASRKGSLLYSFYEKELLDMIKKRNEQSFVIPSSRKEIQIRIPIKHCIRHFYKFWNKIGFHGNQHDSQLSKFIYL
jgi:hypothetical protein